MLQPVAILALSLALSAPSLAGELVVEMRAVDADGVGPSLGSVRLADTPYGLALYPSLDGLAPGLHGFHVHETPDCGPAHKDGVPVPALAAGPHYDPMASQRHGAPWGDGHLGDLPALYVDAEGKAAQPVLAPRLTLAAVRGRSLMLHAGGDNHADHPAPLGGGGARIACGVIATAPATTGVAPMPTAAETELYAVEIRTGPAWEPSKPANAQAHFGAHSANLRSLRESGALLIGARYGEVGWVVLEASSLEAARALLNVDPAMQGGVFTYAAYPLNVFYPGTLDALTR